jgi:hypothetical protein
MLDFKMTLCLQKHYTNILHEDTHNYDDEKEKEEGEEKEGRKEEEEFGTALPGIDC